MSDGWCGCRAPSTIKSARLDPAAFKICPLHAWKVDLESGAVVRPADSGRCVRSFQTRVEDGVVQMNIAGLEVESDCNPDQQQLDVQQSTMQEPMTPIA